MKCESTPLNFLKANFILIKVSPVGLLSSFLHLVLTLIVLEIPRVAALKSRALEVYTNVLLCRCSLALEASVLCLVQCSV